MLKDQGSSPALVEVFLTLVTLAYFWRKVPETRGRSLEETEQDLAVGPGAVESVPVSRGSR